MNSNFSDHASKYKVEGNRGRHQMLTSSLCAHEHTQTFRIKIIYDFFLRLFCYSAPTALNSWSSCLRLHLCLCSFGMTCLYPKFTLLIAMVMSQSNGDIYNFWLQADRECGIVSGGCKVEPVPVLDQRSQSWNIAIRLLRKPNRLVNDEKC